MSDADFWDLRYQTGQTGWEKGRCAPPIARMLREGLLPAQARIAVVGAGRGNEALEAGRLGYQVTAIDFAPTAVEVLRERSWREGAPLVDVLEADIFAVPPAFHHEFDAVLEHTCFCAIDVERRADYVSVVTRLLKPRGLLFGLFYAHSREGGPPFKTTEQEVRGLFAASFDVERLVVATDSFPERAHEELEFVFRRRE